MATVDVTMADGTQPLEDGLDFPTIVDGAVGGIVRINIENLKKPRLQDLCRTYRLPHTGKMALLRQRLRDFSGQQDNWNTKLKGPARNSHLGTQSSKNGKVTKAASQKQSTKRREALFEPTIPCTAGLPTGLSTAVPGPRWNEAQHQEDMEWARHILNKYPYRNEEAQLELARQQEAESSLSRTFAGDESLRQGIDMANSHLKALLSYVAPPGGIPEASSSGFKARSLSASAEQTDNDHASNRLPLQSPIVTTPIFNHQPPSQPASSFVTAATSSYGAGVHVPTRTITLAKGQKVTFTQNDVRDPPALSFANLGADLPVLNSMWDDVTEHWRGSSPLRIHGVPIPVVYWKDVYTSKGVPKGEVPWMPKQWKGTKSKYFDWKVLVKRWREGTPEQFWSAFTVDGVRLGYKAILSKLEESRKSRNSALSDQARYEYGEQFAETFSYFKNNKRHVKTKACSIAKQYRTLKGLPPDDDDDEE
ncbi:hypothetical protein GALMADRAFT_276082 [Galerina marginata CBS 339.88]|uniref:SAP domain-containing protein n=1 Tax=Galerina marginata (strain CBS 339.88) TaxID=685588 RepID=A0A067TIR4_GALM3|nr:hypothetical protein GALMADRAFT_276082 [Galerina marginata CBS 339.88]